MFSCAMNQTSNLSRNTIVVDAMGSDSGPAEIFEGVKLAFQNLPTLERLILVGDEQILRPIVKRSFLAEDKRLEILHTSEVVLMEDKPVQALKGKKEASMFKAIDLVKEGVAKFMLSAGNTGALMAGGTIKLRPLEGIGRPAIGSVWPSQKGNFILLDAGANPESTPESLVHNAILGAHYAKHVLGVENPRIGLLTIGTEEGKGTESINTAHTYLKNCSSFINYQGRIEGFNVFENCVEVIVCDGFVGNIVLKTCESLFKMLKSCLAEELTQNLITRVGGLLALPAFSSLKERLNPDQFGGAPLLGLKGHILKSHGKSSRYAFMNAIRIGLMISEKNMNDDIALDAAKANQIIQDELAIKKNEGTHQ